MLKRIIARNKITGDFELFCQTESEMVWETAQSILATNAHKFSGYSYEKWDERLQRWHAYFKYGII